MTAALLTPDNDLTPSEWLRRYALSYLKYGGEHKARLLEIADILRNTEITRDALAHHLDSIAVTLKGNPEPNCVWGWDDLPELVEKLVAQLGRPGEVVH